MKSKSIIPELYIALRNFPTNVGADCGSDSIIDRAFCEMFDPHDEDSMICKYYRKEDIALWEAILREKE